MYLVENRLDYIVYKNNKETVSFNYCPIKKGIDIILYNNKSLKVEIKQHWNGYLGMYNINNLAALFLYRKKNDKKMFEKYIKND